MRVIARLLLVSSALALAASCAITSGSTFSRVVEAETTETSDDPDPGTQDQDALSIRTDPDDASVWLDNSFLGTTPLSLDELEPGTYRLRVEKEGYYPVRQWLDVPEDGSVTLSIRLEQITGHLLVETEPLGADLRVDGNGVSNRFVELPVGTHRVGVRLFGYLEQSIEVEIEENEVSLVSVTLEPAPFELGRLSASRRRFNPANPGATGFVRVLFEVSGPGEGRLTVRDAGGTLIQSVDLGPFTTWEQSIRWPPENQEQRLEDGSYDLEVTLRGADGRDAVGAITVVIDSSLLVRYRSIWHGAPGLLYGMAPAPLPPANVQASVQLAGIATELEAVSVSRFPVKIGARIGIGADAEIAVYGSLLANSAPLLDRWGAGLALTWLPLTATRNSLGVAAGVVIGGSYRTPSSQGLYAGPDTMTDFPGISVSIPLLLSAGSLSFTAAPEIRLARAPIVYGPSSAPNVWTPYGYARFGALAEIRAITAGLSAALRTVPLNAGFRFDLPMQAGAEVHWVIPGTSLVVTAFAAGEFESLTDFYVMGGGGFGILF